jgi:hypothetical protein
MRLEVGRTYRYAGVSHDTIYTVLERVSDTHVNVLILSSDAGPDFHSQYDPGTTELLHRESKWALESSEVA